MAHWYSMLLRLLQRAGLSSMKLPWACNQHAGLKHRITMDSPTIPQYLYDIGVTAIEKVSSGAQRPVWRVDLANGESKILRMTPVVGTPTPIHRDAIVSRLGLGRFGPPPVEHISLVPRLGYMVRIEVRHYVQGMTLAEIAPYLDDTARARLTIQLYDAINEHGSIRSDYFSTMDDEDDVYANAQEYMRSVKDSHLCGGYDHCRIRRMRIPRIDDTVKPVLCHNSLTPDHIIVHSDRIVAIVGWSRCSFGFMQLQAASYAYRLDLSSGGDDEWSTMTIITMVNLFSTKRDRILEFCVRMHQCRLVSSHECVWLDHLLSVSRSQ